MRSLQPLRKLNAEEVGAVVKLGELLKAHLAQQMESNSTTEALKSDPVYLDVLNCIDDGFAGVIFSGPPGTSKSWYASKIAELIAGDRSRVLVVQFHPSFQYEDFIQGWVANASGGFSRENKHFLKLCDDAKKSPDFVHVLVIDEVNRADAARVFGEALTYLETSKREIEFRLASGDVASIPKNVFVIATMNPWDISIDQLDYALERRFAYVVMPPRADLLAEQIRANGADESVVESATRFFAFLQGRANPMLHLGHAYFMRVRDPESLQRVWAYQIRPHVVRVTRLEPAELQTVENAWVQITSTEVPAQPDPDGADVALQT